MNHVPFLLLAKNQLHDYTGKVSNVTVGHVDVMSTLADLLGVPEGGFTQYGIGRSIIRKEKTPKRIYTQMEATCTVQEGYMRSICSCSMDWGGTCRLYNTAEDPDLITDLRASVTESESALITARETYSVKLAKYSTLKQMQDLNVP